MAFDMYEATMKYGYTELRRPDMARRFELAGITAHSEYTLEEFCKIHKKLTEDPIVKERAEKIAEARMAKFNLEPFGSRHLEYVTLRKGIVAEALLGMSSGEKRALRERLCGVLTMPKRAEVTS